MEREFHRALQVDREELLKPRKREKKRICHLMVVDLNLRLPDISTKIVKKNISLMSSSPALESLFPQRSIVPAFRRCKNLRG